MDKISLLVVGLLISVCCALGGIASCLFLCAQFRSNVRDRNK